MILLGPVCPLVRLHVRDARRPPSSCAEDASSSSSSLIFVDVRRFSSCSVFRPFQPVEAVFGLSDPQKRVRHEMSSSGAIPDLSVEFSSSSPSRTLSGASRWFFRAVKELPRLFRGFQEISSGGGRFFRPSILGFFDFGPQRAVFVFWDRRTYPPAPTPNR